MFLFFCIYAVIQRNFNAKNGVRKVLKKFKTHLSNSMPFVLGSIIITGLGFAVSYGMKKYNANKAGA